LRIARVRSKKRIRELKTFLVVKKGKRNGREEGKEDIVENTRLVLAKPVNELGTKRGSLRGDLAMMQVIELEKNLTNNRPTDFPSRESMGIWSEGCNTVLLFFNWQFIEKEGEGIRFCKWHLQSAMYV
jgi:hypothetical protein